MDELPRPPIGEIDRALVKIARKGREDLTTNVGAVVPDALQVLCGLDAGQQGDRVHVVRANVVVVERDETLDAKETEVSAGELGVARHGGDDLEPLLLKCTGDHPFELDLVRRPAEARDQRDAATGDGCRPQNIRVPAAEAMEVACE
jgi:hypothetical protein